MSAAVGAKGMDPARVAAALVERVAARNRSAEARARVSAGVSGLTRFANSFIHQNVAEQSAAVGLDVAVDGRLATAHTNRTDDASLDALVHAALAAAEVRPVDPGWAGLAPPAAVTGAEHHDAATAAASPDQRAAVVGAFVAAGEGLAAAGFCSTGAVTAAFANSAGQAVEGRSTRAALDGVHRAAGEGDATADGVAARVSVALSDLDGAAAGELAAAKARAGTRPVELPPGRYEVVLEPRCVADLVDFLAIYGFNARPVLEGQSFARPGEAQLDPALSLWDDAGDHRSTGLLFDHEGTPKRRVPLVDAGTVVGLAHDRRTAARSGTESTGHAVPGGESFGAVPTNLFLGPSAAERSPAPADPAELVASLERGLLVSDFWYTRVLDPKTLVVTGLTRNGVFLVEGGEVVGPVTNLRFTQSYPGALAPGRVIGVGSDARLVSGYSGVHHVPTLRLASWNFTGNARG
ncbi:MAG TPA: metallopeptidase TldD-related protein [Acidimicrobiales bacterium]|nr:metallopeptidase TldD-related protein [Acidimicrobiales bacterium]